LGLEKKEFVVPQVMFQTNNQNDVSQKHCTALKM